MRVQMRKKVLLVVTAAFAAAISVGSAAEAAKRKTTATVQQAGPVQRTIYTSVDESGRRRTQVIVQRRSYLDAGTEVLPGQRRYNDYAAQPFRDPFDVLGPGKGGFDRNPIGPRWEFGGANY